MVYRMFNTYLKDRNIYNLEKLTNKVLVVSKLKIQCIYLLIELRLLMYAFTAYFATFPGKWFIKFINSFLIVTELLSPRFKI
jgi:hypothetical protein